MIPGISPERMMTLPAYGTDSCEFLPRRTHYLTCLEPALAGPRERFQSRMNANGEITGYYVDENDQQHGFVRDALGDITTFDAAGMKTRPTSINLGGVVTGYYGRLSNLRTFLSARLGGKHYHHRYAPSGSDICQWPQ